jgi:hypothetical protein
MSFLVSVFSAKFQSTLITVEAAAQDQSGYQCEKEKCQRVSHDFSSIQDEVFRSSGSIGFGLRK